MLNYFLNSTCTAGTKKQCQDLGGRGLYCNGPPCLLSASSISSFFRFRCQVARRKKKPEEGSAAPSSEIPK